MPIEIIEQKTPAGKDRDARAIVKFMHLIASQLDYDDAWVLELHKQVTSKVRFTVRQFDRHMVLVRVMPGDNGTCWECRLKPKKFGGFAVGRELTLWNGFDGHNVPAAVKANAGEADDHELQPAANTIKQAEVSILDRLSGAEKIAKSYRERAKAIANGESRVLEMMAEAERAQSQVEALRDQHTADAQGKAACDAIDAVSRLFALS